MSYEVVTFLSMNGRGAEAIDFYTQHLNAKVIFKVTYEDMKKMDPSMVVETGKEQWISHSILEVGVHKLMLAEETMVPKLDYIVGNNISLCIQSAEKQEIEKIYNSLIQDPTTEVITPLGKIVFSEAYGIVKDPFGVLIQLNYDKRLAK
ncbi:VOC family protein [Desulfosporosinus lacus]|uniref:PhnB protein n=1 Tax=Desulfosporosinus lacus DSM 15449 TaxID=1121420 RepID=A0A1M5ZUM4_9FIRM|nr:VOC family protein [Desulfosporosinus lacus]SHI27836.1 PhnB protein [Desulfosporosinus lacus DSM 15449]